MTKRKSYTLNELVAQCDPGAPIPPELMEWERAEPVGLEKVDMTNQVDLDITSCFSAVDPDLS